ncbi:hypothetical protein [Chromobacterium vaccinii]|uniref:hypothetical protein n=1 Tax=Chromobacterium vaccinii TaxID=1108595 RepID=UPI001E29F809|nr:hypothetical protein [Chromobacterium vaccinii]MCD4499987.1 hypothetical protein [Chromobacterium vaccinii]
MLAKYKRNTNIGIFLGVITQGGANGIVKSGVPIVGLIIAIIGAGFFIWGCSQYSKGKGYSGKFGLLGLLSIFGLVVLALMPDKHKGA